MIRSVEVVSLATVQPPSFGVVRCTRQQTADAIASGVRMAATLRPADGVAVVIRVSHGRLDGRGSPRMVARRSRTPERSNAARP